MNTDLSRAALYVQPVHIDWFEDDGERWEEVYPPGVDFNELDNDPERYSPVMNYYYPLPKLQMSAEEAQRAIADTACVVVRLDDEPVLALAGGGMDLTWEIIEAYVILGYLPPLYFCDPPMMVESEDYCRHHIDRIQVCYESVNAARLELDNTRARLERTERWYRERLG